jgi:hypothetical protein
LATGVKCDVDGSSSFSSTGAIASNILRNRIGDEEGRVGTTDTEINENHLHIYGQKYSGMRVQGDDLPPNRPYYIKIDDSTPCKPFRVPFVMRVP